MPDLAVEIKSPDDRVAVLRAKAAYDLANNARLVLRWCWAIFFLHKCFIRKSVINGL
jgi:hypothetical protein